jgi:hypothetical protein
MTEPPAEEHEARSEGRLTGMPTGEASIWGVAQPTDWGLPSCHCELGGG